MLTMKLKLHLSDVHVVSSSFDPPPPPPPPPAQYFLFVLRQTNYYETRDGFRSTREPGLNGRKKIIHRLYDFMILLTEKIASARQLLFSRSQVIFNDRNFVHVSRRAFSTQPGTNFENEFRETTWTILYVIIHEFIYIRWGSGEVGGGRNKGWLGNY